MTRLPPTRIHLSAIALLFLTSMALSTACSHTMEIRNRDAFRAVARTETSIRVGIERNLDGDESELALAEALQHGLMTHGSIERVAFVDSAPADFVPDYLIQFETKTEYDGSGLNYWITFPGFLVFAHAWNGLAYEADVRTRLSVRHASSEGYDKRLLETKYDLRHATFLRGALISSGWYTPFYGGLNLIMGFFMLPYDNKATTPFLREVQKPYGSYVANTAVEMIRDQEIVRAKLEEQNLELAAENEAATEAQAQGAGAGADALAGVQLQGSVDVSPVEIEPDGVAPEAPATVSEPEAGPSY